MAEIKVGGYVLHDGHVYEVKTLSNMAGLAGYSKVTAQEPVAKPESLLVAVEGLIPCDCFGKPLS